MTDPQSPPSSPGTPSGTPSEPPSGTSSGPGTSSGGAPQPDPPDADEATWERLRGMLKEEVGAVAGGLEALISKVVDDKLKGHQHDDGKRGTGSGGTAPPPRRRRLLDIL